MSVAQTKIDIMIDTPSDGQQSADDQFQPERLRTIADMRRSSSDSFVAGVCAGAARYLGIDPIVVRVVLAVLTIAGLAGVILYVAAWLLIPADNEPRSYAATWFNLGKNEEQVRTVGLITAGIVAVISAVGADNWLWWDEAVWWIVPVVIVAYLISRRSSPQSDDAPAPGTAPMPATPPSPSTPVTRSLTFVTASITAIALGIVWLLDSQGYNVTTETYLVVALGTIAVGTLVGTWWGNAAPLITAGCIIAVTLAANATVPRGPVGEAEFEPVTTSQVQDSYTHGIGDMTVDLSRVSDPSALVNRTITIKHGIGNLKVIVPRNTEVDVDASVSVGAATVFGRVSSGLGRSVDVPSSSGAALKLDISHRIGELTVTRS
jgi:phage shock protein PspC (stress-responsive transcriptional regulator)